MKKEQPTFSTVLTEAVRDGLNSISPCISDAVLAYLQIKARVQPDCSAMNPKHLDEGLKEVLGYGTETVERRILESLHLRLEVKQKLEASFDFAEEVTKAQKLFSSVNTPLLEPLTK